jgi:beta-N-acetylhexosaminidase
MSRSRDQTEIVGDRRGPSDRRAGPRASDAAALPGIGSAAAMAALPGCSSRASTAPTSPPGSARRSTPPSPASPSTRNAAALRRKIASLLVVGFRGEKLDDHDWIMTAVRDGLGGVILFDQDLQTKARRNIVSPGQVTALVKTLRQASPGRLIVSIDQEGGRTSRLNPSNGFPATKSEAEIGAEDSPAATRAWAQAIVNSLTSIGANLNYAPVVDLDLNPDNPAIGKLGRSFSPKQVYDARIVDETLDNVVNLVRTGRITEARIDQSVARVDALRPQR